MDDTQHTYSTPRTGILITEPPGARVIAMTPLMEFFCGFSREDLGGKGLAQALIHHGGRLLYPDGSDMAIEFFNRLLLSAEDQSNTELILRRPDGKEQRFSMVTDRFPWDGRQRAVSMFTPVPIAFADDPAVKRLRQEVEQKALDLKMMNTKFETIYNASSESIWVLDGKGTVESINRASEALWDITAENVVGKDINDLIDAGLMDRSVTRQVIESGRQVSLIQSAFKTGKQLLLTGTPVFDENGAITMVIVNERDMTQLSKLERQLQQVKKEKSRIRDELTTLTTGLDAHEIVAHGKEMQGVLLVCRKLAQMNVSGILIQGESGTGKGLMAKYIHSCNPARSGPLVKINCAAVPENLLEAELFGYEPGAFTGAKDQGKIGLFEAAENGTLFLDEIGELSLSIQAKLLTCLEEKEVMHIGGLKPIRINCNIIAATNENLGQKVKLKHFRKDLYFRLNAFPVTIPPLRNRPEDIMELALFFLEKYNRAYKLGRRLSPAELRRIQAYPFPGNVRELKNCVKRAVVMAESDKLKGVVGQAGGEGPSLHGSFQGSCEKAPPSFNRQVADFEKKLLSHALKTCKTTRALAAHLDMTQSQVMRKLKKYGLQSQGRQPD